MPEDDLYIEITTMSQKLVTKKNGKLKTLRRLYPQIRCKILYQNDYLHFVEKYGLETPANLAHELRPRRPSGPPTVVRLGGRGPQDH